MYNNQYYPSGNNYVNYAPPADERIWDQSKAAAEAYLVAPGGFVRLWDSNRNVFYEKRADASGRPLPLDTFEYTRISPVQATNNDNSINECQAQIDAILKRIEALEKERGNVKQSDADVTEV